MLPILQNLIDIIYPPRCHVCQEFLWKNPALEELALCKPCFMGLSRLTPPFCPVCGRPFRGGIPENHLCEDCLRKRPFYDSAVAPYRYEGPILEAIHRLKYGAKSFLAGSLGPLLSRFTQERIKEPGHLLTMPVPLHPKGCGSGASTRVFCWQGMWPRV